MIDPLLTEADVAAATGRSISSLRKDRAKGVGIPWVRVGPRSPRYKEADVQPYVEGREHQPRREAGYSCNYLLTQADLALALHRSISSLRRDRKRGVGVPWVRVGRSPRYKASDVRAYLEGLEHQPRREAGCSCGGNKGPAAP